jgi:catechol 2,3-dioxygenase-like lactoylglutathione lyase family enzyme
MMVKVNSISGVSCFVKSLDKTAKFYETLGFRMGKRESDRLTCYVNWFSVTFIAQDKEVDPERKKEAKLANKGAGLYLHVKVDDVDAYYKGVVAKRMKPASAPQKMASGNREFVLRDPDGYKLIFFAKK